MFTGIVSAQGEIKLIKKNNSYTSLSIDAPKGFAKNIKKGGSISVNGVCLTIKSAHSDKLRFDVIEETLNKTNLGFLLKKSKVNLERSIKANSEIGGHLVSGHIHGVGKVKKGGFRVGRNKAN